MIKRFIRSTDLIGLNQTQIHGHNLPLSVLGFCEENMWNKYEQFIKLHSGTRKYFSTLWFLGEVRDKINSSFHQNSPIHHVTMSPSKSSNLHDFRPTSNVHLLEICPLKKWSISSCELYFPTANSPIMMMVIMVKVWWGEGMRRAVSMSLCHQNYGYSVYGWQWWWWG